MYLFFNQLSIRNSRKHTCKQMFNRFQHLTALMYILLTTNLNNTIKIGFLPEILTRY